MRTCFTTRYERDDKSFEYFITVTESLKLQNDTSKLDHWAHNNLHGKAYNRWFDKSFNFIISKNGRFGVNVEHSWGDAAITAHFVEYVLLKDYCVRGYKENGDCTGEVESIVHPERLKWQIDEEIESRIETSLAVANSLISDVEMALLVRAYPLHPASLYILYISRCGPSTERVS